MLCDVSSYSRVAKFLFVDRCEFEPWQLGFFLFSYFYYFAMPFIYCINYSRLLTTRTSRDLEPKAISPGFPTYT